jgi:hypothetical protein
MTGNVVHLSFKSPHMADDMMSFVCCGHCKNKTFVLVEDRVGDFPLMKCAACSQHMGRMGWAHDDDPATA